MCVSGTVLEVNEGGEIETEILIFHDVKRKKRIKKRKERDNDDNGWSWVRFDSSFCALVSV